MAITKTLLYIGNVFGITLAGFFALFSNFGDIKQIIGGLYLLVQGIFYVRKMYWDGQLKKIEYAEREYELNQKKEHDTHHQLPQKKH